MNHILRKHNQMIQKFGNDFTAYSYAFIGIVFSFFSTILPKYSSLPFTRSLLCRGIMSSICATIPGDKLHPSNHDIKIIVLRGLLIGFNQYIIYYGIMYFDVKMTFTIFNVGPIIVLVLNYIFRGVSITRKNICGIIIAFSGVLIIIGLTSGMISGQSVLVLIATFSWSIGIVSVAYLQSNQLYCIIFVLGMVFIIQSAIFQMYLQISQQYVWTQYIIILTSGLISTIASFLFIEATLLSEQKGKISLFSYLLVVLGYFFSIFIEGKGFDITQFLGSICILIGLLLTLF